MEEQWHFHFAGGLQVKSPFLQMFIIRHDFAQRRASPWLATLPSPLHDRLPALGHEGSDGERKAPSSWNDFRCFHISIIFINFPFLDSRVSNYPTILHLQKENPRSLHGSPHKNTKRAFSLPCHCFARFPVPRQPAETLPLSPMGCRKLCLSRLLFSHITRKCETHRPERPNKIRKVMLNNVGQFYLQVWLRNFITLKKHKRTWFIEFWKTSSMSWPTLIQFHSISTSQISQ